MKTAWNGNFISVFKYVIQMLYDEEDIHIEECEDRFLTFRRLHTPVCVYGESNDLSINLNA